jgi:hypothetical protein
MLVLCIAEGRCAEGRSPTSTKTENVILITTDGVRWQDVFGGADVELLNKEHGGVDDVAALKEAYWRATPEARRTALMPFLWGVVARHGQVFGDAQRGSVAKVTNGKNFSYPGYNEILAGFGDPRIDSNDKRLNPNLTVLEWLNAKPTYRGRVAAFGSWDVFPFILNRPRSGLLVNSGWQPIEGDDLSVRERLLNDLIRELPRGSDETRLDPLTFHAALEHLKRRQPRVLYLALDETDEDAHEGRYDRYLRAAHRVDSYLKTLWETAQALPQYRDRTTLIVTTDHGRGDAPEDWKHHGEEIRGSERIWIAVLGPDTPPLGARADVEPVTQGQVAATLAALLGEDFAAEAPAAARPIGMVLPRSPGR